MLCMTLVLTSCKFISAVFPLHIHEYIIFAHLVYCFVSVIDILRMLVLHPDGATVLLKHVEDENGTLRCNYVLVLVERLDCKKYYLLSLHVAFQIISLFFTKHRMEWLMRPDDEGFRCRVSGVLTRNFSANMLVFYCRTSFSYDYYRILCVNLMFSVDLICYQISWWKWSRELQQILHFRQTF